MKKYKIGIIFFIVAAIITVAPAAMAIAMNNSFFNFQFILSLISFAIANVFAFISAHKKEVNKIQPAWIISFDILFFFIFYWMVPSALYFNGK